MNSDTNIKKQLYDSCFDFVEDRFLSIRNAIDDIQESLTSETKSSAGDKHETGRAMLQLEREKAGNQLAEIQKLKNLLCKININKSSKTVGLGSLVYTSNANYFIAISAGEIKIGSELFYAISSETPIAKLLFGKEANDMFAFRSNEYSIIRIS